MFNGKAVVPIFLTIVRGLAALLWYLQVAKLPYWIHPVGIVLVSVGHKVVYDQSPNSQGVPEHQHHKRRL